MINIFTRPNRARLILALCLLVTTLSSANLYSQITYQIEKADIESISSFQRSSLNINDPTSDESHMVTMGPLLNVDGYLLNESDDDYILMASFEGAIIVDFSIVFEFQEIDGISTMKYIPYSYIGDYPGENLMFINDDDQPDLSGKRLFYCVIKAHSRIYLPLHASFQIKTRSNEDVKHTGRWRIRENKILGCRANKALETLQVKVNSDIANKNLYDKYKDIILGNPDGLEPLF